MKNIPQFIMMIGLPGSGKSTLAKEIAKNINGQVISSDEIRKEIFGVSTLSRSLPTSTLLTPTSSSNF